MSPVLPDQTIDSINEVGAIAFAVWCKLLVHRNRQTGKCCPSVNTIATALGVDRKTVLRGIERLEKANWLTVVREQTAGGRPIANQYVPAPRLLVAQMDQQDSSVGGTDGPTLVAERDQLVAERDQALVAQRDQNPKKDRTPRSEPNKNGVELPAVLDTPEFRAAWAEWERYRREIKKALTPSTRKRQLAKLSGWGVDRAVAAIEASIEHGWQGLFERNQRNGKPNTSVGPGQRHRTADYGAIGTF